MAGKIIADQIEHSTAGSLNTSYVVNGSAKAWIHFDVPGGTPTSRDSLNMASITDDGTGDYQVNFSSSFANGFYATSGTGDDGQYFFCVQENAEPTSSDFTMKFSYPPSATSDADVDNCSTIHMGELA